MQDTVFGVLYEQRNKVFLEDAFRSKSSAEDLAGELRQEGRKTWVETIDRASVNPTLWRSYGAHPIR
jgi:hypothetical protein